MFSCTSYPQSNLGDFSDFADALNPGGVPVWQQLGFPDKGSWKRAGSPTSGATVTNPGGGFTPPPGTPTIGPGSQTGGGGGQGPVDGGVTGAGAPSSGGGILSGIPSSYLLIGLAVVALMLLKK